MFVCLGILIGKECFGRSGRYLWLSSPLSHPLFSTAGVSNYLLRHKILWQFQHDVFKRWLDGSFLRWFSANLMVDGMNKRCLHRGNLPTTTNLFFLAGFYSHLCCTHLSEEIRSREIGCEKVFASATGPSKNSQRTAQWKLFLRVFSVRRLQHNSAAINPTFMRVLPPVLDEIGLNAPESTLWSF